MRYSTKWLIAFVATLISLGGLLSTSNATASETGDFLVGRGVSDITGQAAEAGMMGYGSFEQEARGIHNRQHARAFVIQDADKSETLLYVVAENGMIFESLHQAVLERLMAKYDGLFNYQNTLLVSTHTHAAAGGYSHHLLYNLTTKGFREQTFNAMADGIVESVDRALADLQPSELRLAQAELHGANAQRSRPAFDQNNDDIKAAFPDAVDPLSTSLVISRDGVDVGVINWFGVHATSMTNQNRLLSSDNKGYAAWAWENAYGVDYRDATAPDFVAAFAQNNAGDMSPNLDLIPGTTPEDFAETVENGTLQYQAAATMIDGGSPLAAGVDSRLVYVDIDNITVDGRFTPDGEVHKTCDPVAGAAMAAGSVEDGPAGEGFYEGKNNPFFDKMSSLSWTFSPELEACQAPKDVLLNAASLNAVWPWTQTRVPVQLVRIGDFYLLGYPGELTIGAGYRLRSTVAEIVGAPIERVIMSSYANSYIHYMTTPEEYMAQNYEGGSTLFGRWQTPAMQQVYAGLAEAMIAGEDVDMGPTSPDRSGYQLVRSSPVVLDIAGNGYEFGEVVTQPAETAVAGDVVSAVFVGAHPNNNLHQADSYMEVQQLIDGQWVRIADDNHWATTFEWERLHAAQSRVTVTWTVPEDAEGTYRLFYRGDFKVAGNITGFTGVTASFTVN